MGKISVLGELSLNVNTFNWRCFKKKLETTIFHHQLFSFFLFFLQTGTRGDRRECEHARGHPQRQGALRGAGAQEVAVWRLVQRRHPRQSDGGRGPSWVTSPRLLRLRNAAETVCISVLFCFFVATDASTSRRPPWTTWTGTTTWRREQAEKETPTWRSTT